MPKIKFVKWAQYLNKPAGVRHFIILRNYYTGLRTVLKGYLKDKGTCYCEMST